MKLCNQSYYVRMRHKAIPFKSVCTFISIMGGGGCPFVMGTMYFVLTVSKYFKTKSSIKIFQSHNVIYQANWNYYATQGNV